MPLQAKVSLLVFIHPDMFIKEDAKSQAIILILMMQVFVTGKGKKTTTEIEIKSLLQQFLSKINLYIITKIRLVKAMVFLVVMYGCESSTLKKAERRRIDTFEL